MSTNGQIELTHRSIPNLNVLPRPLYARVESLLQPASTAWHCHPWAQLSYATHGVLSVHTANGRFVAPPHRAILVPPDLSHAVISSPNTEMRSLYLEPAVVTWAPEHCLVLEITPLTRELISQFGRIPAEYDEQGAEGRLAGVLLDQLRTAPKVGLYLPWPEDPRLQEACEALYANPGQPANLDVWSQRLGFSGKTLTRIFTRETGLSFRSWCQRLRLLSALPLLEQGERITDVALACGYESTSAFIAAFRRQIGVTPGQFLNKAALV